MTKYFFEVQPWEQPIFEKEFPGCVCIREPFEPQTTTKYTDITHLSVFVYSRVTAPAIDQMPHLKLITTRSTGYDHIDVSHACSKGVYVSNVPEYGSNTVAEHTFALILALTRQLFSSILQVKNPDFAHTNLTGVDIFGKTIGIIGIGKIGLRVAQIARGFGMRVLVYNRTQNTDLAAIHGFTYTTLNELLAASDIVTLHLSLHPETTHLINMDNIHRLKKGSYLINTARGGLIQTESIVWALQEGILAGVGLDVLEEEKELAEEAMILSTAYSKEHNLQNILYNHMLLHHPRVVITPHNAFNSAEALSRITQTTCATIRAFDTGKYINVVG
jgi:D-lactate dehydrogenase